MFYVYAYLDPRKSSIIATPNVSFLWEPFYIGKGKGRRDREHIRLVDRDTSNLHKSRRIKRIITETGAEPYIVRLAFGEEIDMLCLEQELIEAIGRVDLGTGPLLNLSDGGDGCSGMSADGRDRLSSRMRTNNPNSGGKVWERVPHPFAGKGAFTGKKHSDEAKRKISETRATESSSTKEARSVSFKKTWEERKEQWCKSYELTSPNGEIFVVSNGLEAFLKEKGLNQPIIYRMIREPGYTPSRGACVGWVARKLL